MGVSPVGGANVARVTVNGLKASEWRGMKRNFEQALDLGDRTMMGFNLLVPQNRPGWEVYVRVVLGNGSETAEYVTEIIPTLWQTIVLNIEDCNFRNHVTQMEIDIKNRSEETWQECRFYVDEVVAGKPLDLEFELPQSTEAFKAENGMVSHENDALRLDLRGQASVWTTRLEHSYHSIYNPPLDVYNTIFVVLENRSEAQQMRVYFQTDGQQGFTRSRSKVVDLEAKSGKKAYYVNLSDLAEARGHLTGLKFEPIGATSGTLWIDRINFQKEEPIEDFAGEIDHCTANKKYVRIEGSIEAEYVERYPILEIYEAPMYLYGKKIRTVEELNQPNASGELAKPSSLRMTDLEGLTCLYKGASAQKFNINRIPNRRPEGRISLLSSRLMAIVRDEKGNAMKVAPCFYIENWADFEKNPYAFKLPKREFNVEDYGAKGDGFTDDTEAINRAIDACHAAGGGRVTLEGDEGRYGRRYIATEVRLKSHVELHLEAGAILWQSPDRRDYRYNMYYGHDMDIPGVNWTHCLFINKPLVLAKNAENVKVTGPGVIRMNDPYTVNHNWGHYAKICSDCMHIVPLSFIDSKNLIAADLDIQRCNNYHTNFHGVENLFLGNIKLYDIKCVSGDGLSFGQGAHHIRVARAVMNTNDDGIVISTSYGDPRGIVTPWRQDHRDADHSVRDLKVTHSCINSTHGAGKAIAFIPWGSTNPDQQKQVIENVEVSDCMLIGGYSVGTWPDNPFDGKPFTNAEQDDYSPIYNINIHDNDYNDPCDLFWVKPTNFMGDTGIKNADSVQNSDFKDGFCFWTTEGDAGVSNHQGYARKGGRLWEGLYLKGDIRIHSQLLGSGSLFIADEKGKILAEKKIKTDSWTEETLELTDAQEGNYRVGVYGKDIRVKWLRSSLTPR